jgi:hypothetical protein
MQHIPTVHLNGTPKARLVEQLENAANALNAALDALAETTPNGRDYYVQGDSALYDALHEHRKRMMALRTVLDEIQEIWEGVVNQ